MRCLVMIDVTLCDLLLNQNIWYTPGAIYGAPYINNCYIFTEDYDHYQVEICKKVCQHSDFHCQQYV